MNINLKKPVAIDIETIGNRDVIPLLPEPEPDSRLKDPAKIEADIKNKREKQIQSLGLSPWTGRICYIGAAYMDDDELVSNGVHLQDETDEAEKDMLEIFVQIVCNLEVKYGQLLFATFNGIGFDVPFLNGRTLALRSDRSLKISTKKYSITNHLDVKAVLSNWEKFQAGTLDFFSSILLGENKTDGIDGSMIQSMWDNGEIDTIGDYCKKDCELTYKLAELVLKYYL